MDLIPAFTGRIVIEPQNESIDRQIGKSGVAHLTIDLDFLHITNGPIVGSQTCGTDFPDGCPTVIVQNLGGQCHFNGTGLIGRGRVVGASGHADGDCSVSFGLGGNSYHRTGNTHRSHRGGAGSGRNLTITRPCHGDGVRGLCGGQFDGSFIQRQTTSGLGNAPSNRFGPGASISPLVVRFRREGGIVGTGVRAAGSSSKRHFPAVIVAPSGALGRTGISKAVALRGDRHGGGVDRPSHFLGGLCAVCPLILPFRRESGRVGSRIGAGSHAAQGQRIGVISVPRRALGLSVIGQGAILRRKNIDGIDDTGHSIQGRICGILCVLCGFHTGSDLVQQIRVGGLIKVVFAHLVLGRTFGIIVHVGKLFGGNLTIHQISLPGLIFLKGFNGIRIGLHLGINLIHVFILNPYIIKFRFKGFSQLVVGCFIRHSSKPRFSTDYGYRRQAGHG